MPNLEKQIYITWEIFKIIDLKSRREFSTSLGNRVSLRQLGAILQSRNRSEAKKTSL